MTDTSLFEILENLKAILLEEKEMLIQQEGQDIQKIIARKEAIIEELEQAELEKVNEDKDKIKTLAEEVKGLQETNAMLTEQAMNYTNVFLSAFQKEAQKNNTYSKEGSVKKEGSSGILDQSL